MTRETALELLKILEEYSDRDNKLSKGAILAYMENIYNHSIEEKAFYRKIEELQKAGFKIVQTKGRHATYYLDMPRLTVNELLYLSIMIMGSSDISSREANHLISRLQSMPIHKLSNSQIEEYKAKLKSNNMQTDQIKKFAIIFNAMKSQGKLSYREVLDFNTLSFSQTKSGIPQDFAIVNNQIMFVFLEGNCTKTYSLKSLINVEEIF